MRALLAGLAAGCAVLAASPAGADFCEEQPLAMRKPCRDARELLMREDSRGWPPALQVLATGSSQGWRYEYRRRGASTSGPPCTVRDVLVLPARTRVGLLATSEDLVHELKLPALGLDLTGVPGRINELELTLPEPGLFRAGEGQGAAELRVVEPRAYAEWERETLPAGCLGVD